MSCVTSSSNVRARYLMAGEYNRVCGVSCARFSDRFGVAQGGRYPIPVEMSPLPHRPLIVQFGRRPGGLETEKVDRFPLCRPGEIGEFELRLLRPQAVHPCPNQRHLRSLALDPADGALILRPVPIQSRPGLAVLALRFVDRGIFGLHPGVGRCQLADRGGLLFGIRL